MKAHLGAFFGLSQLWFKKIVMDIKCKVVFNIKIIKIIIIHVAINLSENHIKIWMNFKEKMIS